MALKNCKECGAQVSNNATSCPQCGSPQPKKTSVLTWVCVGLLGLAFIIWAMSDKSEPPQTTHVVAPENKVKNVDENSLAMKMDIVDLANCTAASMKMGNGISFYQKWADVLHVRYQKISPSKSFDEIDKYTSERIIDKKKGLERKGIQSQQAFTDYYNLNCKKSEP